MFTRTKLNYNALLWCKLKHKERISKGEDERRKVTGAN